MAEQGTIDQSTKKRVAADESADAGAKRHAPETTSTRRLIVQFRDAELQLHGPELDIELSSDTVNLNQLLNQVLENDEPEQYTFEVAANRLNADDKKEIAAKAKAKGGSAGAKKDDIPAVEHVVPLEDSATLSEAIAKLTADNRFTQEKVALLTYYPLAIFKVRPVTRCSSSMEGHSEAVLCSRFSPDCTLLATGSGDTTVRLWDMNTEACVHVFKGHSHHVLSVEFSPDGAFLASAGMDKSIIVHCPHTGARRALLKGHRDAVTSMFWQPLHCVPSNKASPTRPLLASASKDTDGRIWDVTTGNCVKTLGGHTLGATAVRWSGERREKGGVLYTGARDQTIKMWCAETGVCLKTLKGHAHWINSLATNVDYVLRTGHFEPKKVRELKDKKYGAAAAPVLLEAAESGSPAEDVAGKASETSEPVATESSAPEAGTVAPPTKQDTPAPAAAAATAAATGQGASTDAVVRKTFTGTKASASTTKTSSKASGQKSKPKPSAANNEQKFSKLSANADRSRGPENDPARFELALRRYQEAMQVLGGERLVSSSDDHTMFLWSKPLSQLGKNASEVDKFRLLGHQNTIVQAIFSPDGRYIASAGFDRAIRLWDGRTGRFIAVLRGHVGRVFQISFSADSRLLLSGSQDSTMKVWDMGKRKLLKDLPGHADEVYAVDWAQDGAKACSGSKDRVVKIWRF